MKKTVLLIAIVVVAVMAFLARNLYVGHEKEAVQARAEADKQAARTIAQASSEAPTGAQTRYTSQPSGTSIRIDGTSTAHDWEMEGKMIGGFIEFGAGVTLDKTQASLSGLQGDKVPAKAHVVIPVSSIHAKVDHLPEVMDDLMQKALKADKDSNFPTIHFTLKEMTFKGPHAAGKPFDVNVAGDLVIAGRTNTASFPVTIDPQEGGMLKVSGSAPVKMTAYGVEPPAPKIGLGLMKCGDDVKILFDWKLKEKKQGAVVAGTGN